MSEGHNARMAQPRNPSDFYVPENEHLKVLTPGSGCNSVP